MKREQYQEALASLRNVNPNHPLIERLERGWSLMNVEHMRRVMEELYTDNIIPKDDDPTLRMMWVAVSKMLSRRSIMANEWRSYRTDADRAQHSRRIQTLQAEIGETVGKIDIYRATGDLPSIPIDEANEQELPDDPGALYRKIHSLRTMISQVKRELEQLASMQRSEGGDERINTLHKRLKKLEKTLACAKRKYES